MPKSFWSGGRKHQRGLHPRDSQRRSLSKSRLHELLEARHMLSLDPVLYGPAHVNEGSEYRLGLDPGSRNVVEWVIDWDGAAGTTYNGVEYDGSLLQATHTYPDGAVSGTVFSVEVTAMYLDEYDQLQSFSLPAKQVTVHDVAPLLNIHVEGFTQGTAAVAEGQEFRLYLEAIDPGNDPITGWTIDWGDGTASQAVTGSPTYVTKTYADNPSSGSYYTITASATNDDGTFDLLDSGTAGALDASFGDAGRVAIDFGGGSESTRDAAFDPHGRVVVVGYSGWGGVLARFLPNGAVDTTFGDQGHLRLNEAATINPYAVAIDSQGRIVVAGSNPGNYQNNYEVRSIAARFLVDGSLDTSFGDAGVLYLNLGSSTEYFADLVVLGDDSLVLAATARNSSTSNDDFTLVKLAANGVLDAAFGISGITRADFGSTDTAAALLLLADGDVLITGSTGTTTRSFAAARYSPAGALRTGTFGTSGKVTQAYSGGSAVNTSAVELADGSLVLGGTITVSGNQDFGLLKLSSAGVVQTGLGVNGWVKTAVGSGNDSLQSLALDDAGQVVASGYSANGSSWSATHDMALVRYDAETLTIDTNFGVSGLASLDFHGRNDSVQKLLTYADGKLLAVGYATIRYNSDIAIARFSGDGTLDVSFNGGTATADFASESSVGESVAIDEMGRIVALASGSYNLYYGAGGTGSYHLARLWGDGSLDASFGQGGLVTFGTGSTAFEYDRPRQLRLLEDGNMLVAGEAGYFSPAYLMRLTEAGELDTSFGVNQTGIATTDPAKLSRLGQIAVNAADGSIFMTGSYLTSSYDRALSLAKFTAAGVVDTAFGNQGYIDLTAAVGTGLEMEAIAFQDDGKILVAGTRITYFGNYQSAFIARFNANGTLDTSFGTSGVQALQYDSEDTTVRGMIVLPNDKILLSGTANLSGYPPTTYFVVMRLEADGALDTSFGPTASPGMTAALVASDWEWNEMTGVPFGLLVDRDQRILQVGMASNMGAPIMGMARFTSAGILDTTFADGGVLVNDLDDPADFYGFHRAVAEDRYGRYVIAGTGYLWDSGTGDDLFVSRYHSGSDGLRVTVEDVPPLVTIGGNNSVLVGQDFTLQLSALDQGQDPITQWTIDWGDGSEPQIVVGNPTSLTRAFAFAGTFIISATATNDDGTWIASPHEISVFHSAENLPPQLQFLALGNDTGSPGDGVSRQAVIRGEFTDPTPSGSYSVSVDWNNDGVADATTVASLAAGFTFDLSGLIPYGMVTVRARLNEHVSPLEPSADLHSNWSWLNFRYEPSAIELPSVVNLRLADDDAATAGFTSQPVLLGNVSAGGSLSYLPIEFDLNNDGAADGMVYTDSSGSGEFSISLHDYLFAPGNIDVRVRAGVADSATGTFAFGDWSSLAFQFEPNLANLPGDDVAFLPLDLSYAVFSPGPFAPNYTPPVAAEPMVIIAFALPVANFASFADRFTAPVANGSLNETIPIDTSETFSEPNGSRTVNTLSSTSIIASATINQDGTWSRDEELSATYTITTTFNGTDGSSYSLTQTGTWSYTFDASGDDESASYELTESRLEQITYAHDESYTTINADGSTTQVVREYTSEAAQSFVYLTSGSRVINEDDELVIVEESTYDAEGSSEYTNVYGDVLTLLGLSTPGSASTRFGGETWHYLAEDFVTTTDGVEVSSHAFNFGRNRTEEKDDKTVTSLDLTTSSGGLTQHREEEATYEVLGTYQTALAVEGTIEVDNGSSATTLEHSYSEISADTIGYEISRNEEIADESIQNVVANFSSSSSATIGHERELEVGNSGTTIFSGAIVTSFVGSAVDNATISSTWTSANSASSSGTDTSKDDSEKTFTLSRSSSDSGSSNYERESALGITIDSGGNKLWSGLSSYSDKRSGGSTWSFLETSSLDETDKSVPGRTTVTVANAQSSGSGSGDYLANASGTDTKNSSGNVLSLATSDYTANSLGETASFNDYDSKVEGSDESLSGVTQTFSNHIVTHNDSSTTFTALLTGTSLYLNGAKTLNDKAERNESGERNSSSSSDSITTVVDNSVSGRSANTESKSFASEESASTFTYKYNNNKDTNDAGWTFSEAYTHKESGTNKFNTNSSDKSSIDDNSHEKIDAFSETNSAATKDGNGTFESENTGSANSSSAGSNSSSSSSNYSEVGTYQFTRGDSLLSDTTDTTTEFVTSIGKIESSDEEEGTGSYTITRTQNDSHVAGAAAISTASSVNTWEESGTTKGTLSRDAKTETDEDKSVTVRTGVTKTFSDENNHTEERVGTFSSSSSHSDARLASGALISANGETRADKGTTTWNQTTNNSYEVTDVSVDKLYAFTSETVNSSANGSDSYENTFQSASEVFADGKTSSSRFNGETTSGTSTTTTDVATHTNSTDTREAGIVRTSAVDTTRDDEDTLTYETSDEDNYLSLIDGTVETGRDKSRSEVATGTTDWTNNVVNGSVETSNTGGIDKYFTSDATIERTGKGTYTSTLDDVSNSTNGKTHSWRLVTRSEEGKFDDLTTQTSSGKSVDTTQSLTSKISTHEGSTTDNSEDVEYFESYTDYSEAFTDGRTETERTNLRTEEGQFTRASDQTNTVTIKEYLSAGNQNDKLEDVEEPTSTELPGEGDKGKLSKYVIEIRDNLSYTNGTFSTVIQDDSARTVTGQSSSYKLSSRDEDGESATLAEVDSQSWWKDTSVKYIDKETTASRTSIDASDFSFDAKFSEESKTTIEGVTTSTTKHDRHEEGTLDWEWSDVTKLTVNDKSHPMNEPDGEGGGYFVTIAFESKHETSENGSGDYKAATSSAVVNGKTSSKEEYELDGDGSFFDETTSTSLRTETHLPLSPGLRTSKSGTEEKNTVEGTFTLIVDDTKEQAEGGQITSSSVSDRSEVASLTWKNHQHSSATITFPNASGEDKEAGSTNNNKEDGQGNYTSSLTRTVTVGTQGTSTIEQEKRNESGAIQWQEDAEETSKGNKTDTAWTGSTRTVTADGLESSTDHGNGAYSIVYDITTKSGAGGESKTGSRTVAGDGQADITWKNRDSLTSTDKTYPSSAGISTWRTTGTLDGDEGTGDYSYEYEATTTYLADGQVDKDGTSKRVETKSGTITQEEFQEDGQHTVTDIGGPTVLHSTGQQIDNKYNQSRRGTQIVYVTKETDETEVVDGESSTSNEMKELSINAYDTRTTTSFSSSEVNGVFNEWNMNGAAAQSTWKSSAETTFNKRGENTHNLEGGGTVTIKERWIDDTTTSENKETISNGYEYEDFSQTQTIAYRRSDTTDKDGNTSTEHLATDTTITDSSYNYDDPRIYHQHPRPMAGSAQNHEEKFQSSTKYADGTGDYLETREIDKASWYFQGTTPESSWITQTSEITAHETQNEKWEATVAVDGTVTLAELAWDWTYKRDWSWNEHLLSSGTFAETESKHYGHQWDYRSTTKQLDGDVVRTTSTEAFAPEQHWYNGAIQVRPQAATYWFRDAFYTPPLIVIDSHDDKGHEVVQVSESTQPTSNFEANIDWYVDQLGAGTWDAYLTEWNDYFQDWSAFFGWYDDAIFGSLVSFVADPQAQLDYFFIDNELHDYSDAAQLSFQYLVDAGAGLIDGTLDTLNPFDNYWSIPDIGPQFGHTTAYTVGYAGGVVLGIGTQISLGNVGALGLCGTKLGTAISLYNKAQFVGDLLPAVDSAVNLAQGNGTWGDIGQLAMTAVSGSLASKGGCFVAGTQVVMAEGPVEQHAVLVTLRDDENASKEASLTVVLFAAGVPLAIVAERLANRKRKVSPTRQSLADQALADEAVWEDRPRYLEYGWDEPVAEDLWEDEPVVGEPLEADPLESLALQLVAERSRLARPRAVGDAAESYPPALATKLCKTPSSAVCWPQQELAMSPSLEHKPTLHAARSHAPHVSRTLEPSQPTPIRVHSAIMRTCSGALYAFLAVAVVWFGWQRYAGDAMPRYGDALAQAATFVSQPAAPRTQSIESIRNGRRVVAKNPELTGVELADLDIDPATWRDVVLQMDKPNGDRIDITLLRRWIWIYAHQAKPGSEIDLDLSEMGIAGHARVVRLDPCPDIEPDDGTGRRIVTGTFKHSSGEILEVTISGSEGPISCTANHPFWSEDQQDFIPAGKLRAGDHVRMLSGQIARVESVLPRPGPQAVYNLEVDGAHVYHVGLSGILVHNTCVYREMVDGKPRYIGITDKIDRRTAEHLSKGRIVKEIESLPDLTRKEARALEHLLIEKYGRKNKDTINGLLDNKNRGIDPRKLHKYDVELAKARDVITALGL